MSLAKKMAEEIRQTETKGEEIIARAKLAHKQRLEQAAAEADAIRREAKISAEQAAAETLVAADREEKQAAAEAQIRARELCQTLEQQAAARRSQAVDAVTALLIK